MSEFEDILVFLQIMITCLGALLSFMFTIFKAIRIIEDSNTSQRNHEQTILDRIVKVVENIVPTKGDKN